MKKPGFLRIHQQNTTILVGVHKKITGPNRRRNFIENVQEMTS